MTSGAACFDGKSALAIPAFSNMDYGGTFYMNVRYKQRDPAPDLQAIVFNGDCGKTPTMVLGTKPSGNYLSLLTNLNEEKELWVPSKVICFKNLSVSTIFLFRNHYGLIFS